VSFSCERDDPVVRQGAIGAPPHYEWHYHISRSGRMTVFASAGNARTFNYQAGDVLPTRLGLRARS
jgi:oxalate decarboxylase/phosphoglucose isomerase-like protein (cupin superfamily)